MRSNPWIYIPLIATVFITVAFLWFSQTPLGIPDEWIWQRIEVNRNQHLDFGLGLCETGIVAAICLAYILCGVERISLSKKKEVALWMIGLVAVGFLWSSSVQKLPPVGKHLIKPSWVIYDPASSGYFFDAAYEIDDLSKYLADYESLMEEGDILHKGTHPPGLFVLNEYLIRICERSRWLRKTVLATRPISESEMFDGLFQLAKVKRKTTGLVAEPLTEARQAALWLVILLTQFTAVLTVVPIYFLVRLQFDRPVSWVTASCWLFVPAMGVFLPKSDALYPSIGMTFLAFWLYALKHRSRLYAMCSGCVFWMGMTLSLALLPVALLGVLLTVKQFLPSGENNDSSNYRKIFELMGCSFGSFIALCLLVWVIWDLNLFNIWLWNYRNHAGFYEDTANQRTYPLWLLVNLGELGFGLGLPILLGAIGAAFLVWKNETVWYAKSLSPVFCTAFVWGLLWISGKNMGEAARLWLVMMPMFVWSSAKFYERIVSTGSDDSRWWNSPLFFLILAQILCCMATVGRVNGFPNPSFI